MVTIEKLKEWIRDLEGSRRFTELDGSICDRGDVDGCIESIEREVADLYREEARGK